MLGQIDAKMMVIMRSFVSFVVPYLIFQVLILTDVIQLLLQCADIRVDWRCRRSINFTLTSDHEFSLWWWPNTITYDFFPILTIVAYVEHTFCPFSWFLLVAWRGWLLFRERAAHFPPSRPFHWCWFIAAAWWFMSHLVQRILLQTQILCDDALLLRYALISACILFQIH